MKTQIKLFLMAPVVVLSGTAFAQGPDIVRLNDSPHIFLELGASNEDLANAVEL